MRKLIIFLTLVLLIAYFISNIKDETLTPEQEFLQEIVYGVKAENVINGVSFESPTLASSTE